MQTKNDKDDRRAELMEEVRQELAGLTKEERLQLLLELLEEKAIKETNAPTTRKRL